MNIESISGLQVFDSRGNPTVECTVVLSDGSIGRAIVPSGASTGSKEAFELRDGGGAFGGMGVGKAIVNISDVIAPELKNAEASDQQAIDKTLIALDGTENRSKLGANATLAVSLAVAKAAASSRRQPLYVYIGELANNATYALPLPQINILNGGRHAEGSTDIQEFMIIPVGAADFLAAMRMASEVYHSLGKVLKKSSYTTAVGDEGGYAPGVHKSEDALKLICTAVIEAGYQLGTDIALALDVAASELITEAGYNFAGEGNIYSSEHLIDWYEQLIGKYPIISIEDGLAENDWAGWELLNVRLGNRIQLVGDDVFVTSTKLLRQGINQKAANAILIKPNQVGTLSETIDAVQTAQRAGWRTIMSHRSGETEDVTIAHLAVGLNTGQIKTGSFARSERIAKYNELLRIANELQYPQLTHPFKESGSLGTHWRTAAPDVS